MNPTPMANSYLNLPPIFYEYRQAEEFPNPKLILFNKSLAQELGFSFDDYSEEELAKIFSGQKLLKDSKPVALAYAGFQFGHPVPSLGDGRALLLGELKGHDLQLKGSGVTSFSRRGDGRSALGPVLREYIVSEFMNTIGIPTTRALAAVTTGENVFRQFGPEPGGIFTRVASSHLRVGTFQYAYFQNDKASLEKLLDYTVQRHYPELSDLSLKEKALQFLETVSKKQGELIAQWSAVGFIHGVMNTDNCSVAGITIDYGPCAFMDEFRFHKVFSSIDERGRYSFFNQVPIIQWNLLRLADCLLGFISEDQDEAVKIVEERLYPILSEFPKLRMKAFAKKLGINDYNDSDEELVMKFLSYLEKESLDYTLAFRYLETIHSGENIFYPHTNELQEFLKDWKQRVPKVPSLEKINPLYIPRNHLIQKAIDLAYQGDFNFTKELIQVLSDPFTERAEFSSFASPPREEEKVTATFCGT
ncbi:MAG TPA: YdiU family protein [Bacteriovoracaceae bacterium]|nr:YdiU family protein [Bacteriovoracaceae bacterium]